MGLPIFLIEVTAPYGRGKTPKISYENRRPIIIIARHKPIDSPTNFEVQGILKFLFSEDPIAVELREFCVFKICPMVNPDGVLIGNSRCSLSGEDLSNVWLEPDSVLNPEVYSLKKKLVSFIEKFRETNLAFDLSCSPTTKGVHLLGCEDLPSDNSNVHFIAIRLFARLFKEYCKSVDLDLCTNKISYQ